jgi:hypothetical protein
MIVKPCLFATKGPHVTRLLIAYFFPSPATMHPQYAGWPFIHLGVAATLFYYNAKDKYRMWRSPAS